MRISIPGQARAKKNSTQQKWSHKRKRRITCASDLYQRWATIATVRLKKQKLGKWKGEYPVEVVFFFFRENKRKWDIDNMFCGTLDVLQSVGILEDDSMNHVIPVFHGWAIDKHNPRTEILIKPVKKIYYRGDMTNAPN